MADENNINEHNEENNLDKFKSSEDGFKLPEGYFDSFSAKLFSKIEAADELAEFKLLSGIPKQNTFSVPDAYFENMAIKAEAKAELGVYEKLAAIKNVYAAEVPENYFESLAGNLTHKIEIYEETKAFAALSVLDKANCFDVNEEYFDTLSQRVMDRIHAPKPMGVMDWLASIFFPRKLAYAFGIVLVVGLSLFYFTRTDEPVVTKTDCGSFACLEKHEILNSSDVKDMDEESLIDMVDVKALSDSLNMRNSAEDNKKAADFVMENSDANNIIDEL